MNFSKFVLFVSMVESHVPSKFDQIRDLRLRMETKVAYNKCTSGYNDWTDPLCQNLLTLLEFF